MIKKLASAESCLRFWYSVAMLSSLLGLLLKKRFPLRQPSRGREAFAQVLAAIVLLVIATVAASTVARRPPPTPFGAEREAAIEPGESPLRNWLSDAVPVR